MCECVSESIREDLRVRTQVCARFRDAVYFIMHYVRYIM
jgi:hypothetical protein